MRKFLIVAAAGLTFSCAISGARAQVDLSAYADAEGSQTLILTKEWIR